ncbi:MULTISPECIES: MerR family transcriptional regulator [unclassified Faecalibacterium]|uniref:MerR family transcriptional regulator n=1 Tax=unclassified Faecalibacterium TaxID=2646395 RepID=UPI000B38FC16|nr:MULTISPECIES: MerR family transcriptional regulator [unclassified Faecalibacterium]OUP26359.1 hypothetical protein B5F27_13770 [Faecalibacterium sp. An192]OUQ35973.1 hypothetical protein B5E67_11135 [Faecalibacterium sp. An122]
MQKNPNPCINTGEFARLCNTNKRTLLYYDEIGLFRPAFTDENGYRYYSENQCDLFFTIRCLQEIGMPLKEIRSYIDHRSPEALQQLLGQQKLKVQQELEKLRRIEQVIDNKLGLVDLSRQPQVTAHIGSVGLEQLPAEYLVVSPPINTDDHDQVFAALCSHIGYCSRHRLNAGHPYGAMVSTEFLAREQWGCYSHFFTKVVDEPKGHPCHQKPAGEYAVTYLAGDYYNAAPAFRLLQEYLAQNHLRPGAFCYKEAVLDEVSMADPSGYLTRISVQVFR